MPPPGAPTRDRDRDARLADRARRPIRCTMATFRSGQRRRASAPSCRISRIGHPLERLVLEADAPAGRRSRCGSCRRRRRPRRRAGRGPPRSSARRGRSGRRRHARTSRPAAHRREDGDLVAGRRASATARRSARRPRSAPAAGAARAAPRRASPTARRRSCRAGTSRSRVRAELLAERGEEAERGSASVIPASSPTMWPSSGSSSFVMRELDRRGRPGQGHDDGAVDRHPATARDSIAAAPISANDSMRNSSPKPSIRFSSRPATAS